MKNQVAQKKDERKGNKYSVRVPTYKLSLLYWTEDLSLH